MNRPTNGKHSSESSQEYQNLSTPTHNFIKIYVAGLLGTESSESGKKSQLSLKEAEISSKSSTSDKVEMLSETEKHFIRNQVKHYFGQLSSQSRSSTKSRKRSCISTSSISEKVKRLSLNQKMLIKSQVENYFQKYAFSESEPEKSLKSNPSKSVLESSPDK